MLDFPSWVLASQCIGTGTQVLTDYNYFYDVVTTCNVLLKGCEHIQFDENKVGNSTKLWNVMRLRKTILLVIKSCGMHNFCKKVNN